MISLVSRGWQCMDRAGWLLSAAKGARYAGMPARTASCRFLSHGSFWQLKPVRVIRPPQHLDFRPVEDHFGALGIRRKPAVTSPRLERTA